MFDSMGSVCALVVVILPLACSATPAASTPAAQSKACVEPAESATGELGPVAFLAGAWIGRDGDAETEEHWIGPRGDTMLGVNRTLSGGRTVHHEFMMIERTADGTFYRAWPKGQPAASFRLVDSAPGRVTFEDPQHDFPQRIVYERIGPSTVRASIEGQQDGKARRESWSFERVPPCR